MSKRRQANDDPPDYCRNPKRPKVDSATRSTVKMKLRTVCKDDFLVEELGRVAAAVRQVQHEAFRVAQLYISQCTSTKSKLYDMNVNFWRRCCAGVISTSSFGAKAHTEHPQLEDTLGWYREIRGRDQLYVPSDLRVEGAVVTELADEMLVNAEELLARNFVRHLASRVMVVLRINREKALRLIAKASTANRRRTRDPSPAVRTISRWLVWPCGTRQEILTRKSHFMMKLSRLCELAEREELSTFKVLPVPPLVPRSVRVTTTILYQVCKRVKRKTSVWLPGPQVPQDAAGFVASRDEAWRSLFRVKRIETARRHFAYCIDTDGVSVCVHLQRTKRHDTPITYNFPRDTDVAKVVAIDPGMHSLACAVARGYPVSQATRHRADERAQQEVRAAMDKKQRRRLRRRRKHLRHHHRERTPQQLHSRRLRQRRRRRRKRSEQQQRRRGRGSSTAHHVDEQQQLCEQQRPARRRKKWRSKHRCSGGRHRRSRRRGTARRHTEHTTSPRDLNQMHICPSQFSSQQYTVQVVSSRQVRHESRLHQHRDWLTRQDQRNPAIKTLRCSFPSFKTVDMHTVLIGLAGMFAALPVLLQFGRDQAYRTWRFKLDRFRRKALDEAAARLTPEPGTVVALGDWRCQQLVRGHQRVPLTAFTEALSRRATVVYVDEYRTSQLCSSCFRQLKPAVFTKTQGHQTTTTTTRDVLECRTCHIRWQRDINAGRNLHTLAVAQIRGAACPRPFRRRPRQ